MYSGEFFFSTRGFCANSLNCDGARISRSLLLQGNMICVLSYTGVGKSCAWHPRTWLGAWELSQQKKRTAACASYAEPSEVPSSHVTSDFDSWPSIVSHRNCLKQSGSLHWPRMSTGLHRDSRKCLYNGAHTSGENSSKFTRPAFVFKQCNGLNWQASLEFAVSSESIVGNNFNSVLCK